MEDKQNKIIGWLGLVETVTYHFKKRIQNKQWGFLFCDFIVGFVLAVTVILGIATGIHDIWFSHTSSTYSISLNNSTTNGGKFIAGDETYNFYNESTSITPTVSGTIELNSSSIHETLNDVFNLSPVVFTPNGPSTIISSELATSTLGGDGFYHTNLKLEILTLPDAIAPSLTSITPPNGIVCTTPDLKESGTMLGGQYTARIDHVYTMTCTSNNQILTSTKFQATFSPSLN